MFPVDTLEPPEWIDQAAALAHRVNCLKTVPTIAVDTESNGLHAYREQVCLIQLSDGQTDSIIDPLAIKDLSPLGPLFADPAIEKVFHASEYDILCLRRDFGFSFSNIFDTMVASRILGYTAVGLGAMLAAEFDLALDKKYQQANWAKRPLSRPMLEYARTDVHYLPALRDRLKEQLIDNNYLALAQEDFARLCKVHIKQDSDHIMDLVWRAAGKQELTPIQAAVLKELVEYREKVAQKINVPSYKVLSNAQLLDVTLNNPCDLFEMAENCNLSPVLIERHGEAILKTIKNGLKACPVRRPCRQKPGVEYLERLDALRTWRKKTAQGLKVESDVVLPRDVLEQIAARNPVNHNELEEMMVEIPWRFQTYGSAILETLQN